MAKNNKNIKPVPAGKKNPIEVQCQELVNDLDRMVKARDKNLEASKEQLIEMLKITSDKYRTVTGTMEAMRVIRMVFDGDPEDMPIFEVIAMAKGIAVDLSGKAWELSVKADNLGYAEMDQLCDGVYDKKFSENETNAIEMVTELMVVDLCRNVGPAAEDMVSFLDRVDIELAETTARLDELDPDWAEKYEPTKE